jgi:glycosyltransferase involved in cell wall biosynthesis
MGRPLISVVIPTVNEQKFVGKCIKSVRGCHLSRERYEIIVVDGGSTDSTVEIAKKLGARVLLEKETHGISIARNRGAKVARGKYVAFLDCDTTVPRGWLYFILQGFEQGYDVVCGPVSYGKFWYDVYSNGVFALTNLLGALFFGGRPYYVTAANSAYSAALFWKVGAFRDVRIEDAELSRRLLRAGTSMMFDPRMKIWMSPRRFEHKGFVRTVLGWGIEQFLQLFGGISQKGYTYRHAQKK